MKCLYFVIFILLIILIEIYRELHSFRVKHYTIRSLKSKNGSDSVVFLSDLHLHQYGLNNEELIKEIAKIKPKYILIGGDMIVGKIGCDISSLYPFFEELVQIAPVFYANGNHEQRVKLQPDEYDFSYVEYKKQLALLGVNFLENESTEIVINDTKVSLSGLEVPLRVYTHFGKVPMDTSEITDRIGKRSDDYQILLAHNPAYMDEYLAWEADLVLSGHLHGGIVRLPGLFGAISPAFDLFPKYSGDLYHKNGKDIVVSKGLGTHTVNIRFMNPAEIVVLHFHSC